MSEDVGGLPNVEGLEQFVQSSLTPDKGQQPPQQQEPVQAQPPVQGQPQAQPLGQFKTPEDLYKSYQEIQGFTTRVSQENAQLKQHLTQMQEQMELLRYQQPPQPAPSGQQKWEDVFISNPEEAVADKVQRTYTQMRIAEVLDEEQGRNPQEFQDRYGYALHISRQYPYLVQSAAGVRKLFNMADKAREQDMVKNAHRAVRTLFGEDADLAKLRELAKKNPTQQQSGAGNAYMPDSTLSMRTGGDPNRSPSFDAQINEAAGKGDVDTVISGMFRNILAKT